MFEIINALEIPGYVLFLAIGYFLGSLFRNVGIIKVIVIFTLVPVAFQFAIQVDDMWTATVPLLLGGVIGYWGFEQARQRVLLAFDVVRDWLRRLR